MQGTLQTMLVEMFDPEARTTGVNIGYQISNTLGGGLAPFICVAIVAAAGGQIWPVVVYSAVICAVGVIATASASISTDGSRLHKLAGVDQAKVTAAEAR
jgi:MHS family shikimate/dehydroshikimate transporter-like MFS transporter